MSTRPSDEEFLEWAKNDQNKSYMQNALRSHPDLAYVKDWVSFNQKIFLLVLIKGVFSYFILYCNTIELFWK